MFFGYNVTFILIRKKRNNINKNSIDFNHIETSRTGKIAKAGIMVLNFFISLVCFNIFFYKQFREIIPQFNFLFLNKTIQIIGLILAIGGNLTLNISYRELGIYWEYPIDGKKKKKKLVTTGIYSRIRHPIYLSFFLISIGFWFILLDVFLLILLIIGGIGLYLQALEEEKLLLKVFGQKFINYKEKTGRFFAHIGKKYSETF
jgi:protein-S-isoprenylcysteine O-methyltransferase Ste14